MVMPQRTWYGAAAGYLAMWMAMMVPMMVPSLVPMLSRYRRSLRGVDMLRLHGLTALVGLGYFVVWALFGAAAYAAGAGLGAAGEHWRSVAHWLPVGAGVALLVAGGVQLTPWKARQLALCREGCGCPSTPDALSAWRRGLGLGLRCSLCCAGLMLALLAIGMGDLFAMASVTLAISVERLAPAPLRFVRAAGAAIVVVGLVTIAGA
jgi:predicted metal-binding membrane protein